MTRPPSSAVPDQRGRETRRAGFVLCQSQKLQFAWTCFPRRAHRSRWAMAPANPDSTTISPAFSELTLRLASTASDKFRRASTESGASRTASCKLATASSRWPNRQRAVPRLLCATAKSGSQRTAFRKLATASGSFCWWANTFPRLLSLAAKPGFRLSAPGGIRMRGRAGPPGRRSRPRDATHRRSSHRLAGFARRAARLPPAGPPHNGVGSIRVRVTATPWPLATRLPRTALAPPGRYRPGTTRAPWRHPISAPGPDDRVRAASRRDSGRRTAPPDGAASRA